MINEQHLKRVCKIGCGAECCCYIIGTPTGIECGKLDPETKKALDLKVSTMVAQGDNCEGIQEGE